ncbi:MAG: hypothetical protein E7241_11115 [Lachnospiraceae bacterium]|nr:hypothetical protein [Lachnospiraceae bacterium]
MIIGVDFDGTLSLGEWPACGPANLGLIKYLNKRKAKGDKLILWTCREGADLRNAVRFCKENGLEFHAVNDNVPETIAKYGNNSRKITCDYYIDDRMSAKKIRLANFVAKYKF